MKKPTILIAVLSLLLALGSSGCMGRMATTKSVTNWNMEVTDAKWGRECLFFGMYIIPVYPICGFADLFIVNSIEFWTGENPVSGESPLTEM